VKQTLFGKNETTLLRRNEIMKKLPTPSVTFISDYTRTRYIRSNSKTYLVRGVGKRAIIVVLTDAGKALRLNEPEGDLDCSDEAITLYAKFAAKRGWKRVRVYWSWDDETYLITHIDHVWTNHGQPVGHPIPRVPVQKTDAGSCYDPDGEWDYWDDSSLYDDHGVNHTPMLGV
jgi:hypothetical protein